jgi:hypothetical protein
MAAFRIMKEVFTGNVDELLEHVTDNDKALANASQDEAAAELQIELDQMVEDGLIELVDGEYQLI